MKPIWIIILSLSALALAAVGEFQTQVPEINFNVIVSRPEADQATLSVYSDTPRQIRVSYGDGKKAAVNLPGGAAVAVRLEKLLPDHAYSYQISEISGSVLAAGEFHTARPAGQAFVFAVQADSHLDDASIPALYQKTLLRIKKDRPDFLIDLGDTFMSGKHASTETAANQYYAQRYYFGLIGDQVPLFLALGNHDGEEFPGSLRDWSLGKRKQYFLNPEPDHFYSGNLEPVQDYYAWTWGDALFVVLDPYWSSTDTRGGSQPWNFTLGDLQYQWLKTTLENSPAKYKFIFIHQLTGSITAAARGGKEAAIMHEWGDTSSNFKRYRPGWELPVHQLLVKHQVTAVFHGHDHFFARQELDGVIYQLVSQPTQRNFKKHFAAEYGYVDGLFLPSSGYLRISVDPQNVKLEYIRSAMPNMEKHGIADGMTADTFVLPVRR